MTSMRLAQPVPMLRFRPNLVVRAALPTRKTAGGASASATWFSRGEALFALHHPDHRSGDGAARRRTAAHPDELSPARQQDLFRPEP